MREQWTRNDWLLFAFFAIGTILASSDAMPKVVQRKLFDPYHAKTIPAIVLWIVMQWELWRGTGVERAVSKGATPFPASHPSAA
jgi:hypothetical protein